MTALLPPIFLWLLALGFLVLGYRFPDGSATVPVLVGWLMLVLTTLDIATRLPGGFGRSMARVLNPAMPHHEAPSRERRVRQIVAIAGLVVFVVALLLVGILPASAVFMLIALCGGARVRWWVGLAGAVAMALLIWAVFHSLLGLELFPGLLFDGDW